MAPSYDQVPKFLKKIMKTHLFWDKPGIFINTKENQNMFSFLFILKKTPLSEYGNKLKLNQPKYIYAYLYITSSTHFVILRYGRL